MRRLQTLALGLEISIRQSLIPVILLVLVLALIYLPVVALLSDP